MNAAQKRFLGPAIDSFSSGTNSKAKEIGDG
jgi:hypothetical protein